MQRLAACALWSLTWLILPAAGQDNDASYRVAIEKQLEVLERKLRGFGNKSTVQKQRLMAEILAAGEIAGPLAAPILQAEMKRARDPEMRYMLAVTIAQIGPKTEEALEQLTKIIDPKSGPIAVAVQRNPRPFLLAVATFEDLGSDYLLNVANSAELKPPAEFKEPVKSPVVLDTTGAPANYVRAFAAEALVKTGDTFSTKQVEAILSRASKKVNGREDLITLRATLLACAESGRASDKIYSLMSKYGKNDRQLQAAEKQLRDFMKEKSRKAKLEKEMAIRTGNTDLRTFTLANGTTLLAKFVNLSDKGLVRLANQKGEYIVVPLRQLSTLDQNWVRAKSKE